ncbi:MAG: nuclear transport factor 2 family protein [Pseudomonadota bacterium]
MLKKTTPFAATASAMLTALTLGAAAQGSDPFGPPSRAWEQGPIYRNTIPTEFETHIIAPTEADRARAQRILELYEVLAGQPTIEAVSAFVSDTYIQHSSMLPNGREPLAMLFASSAAENPAEIDVHKVMVVGDWAMAHVNFRQLDITAEEDMGMAAVDMYLFDADGLITEHWDVIQFVPSHQPNPNGMFLKLYEGE